MTIVLYRGSRGRGKTLTMVKDSLKYQKEGWKIYTNLEGTPHQQIDSEFILTLSGDSMLKDSVLLIDEIELFFDSRQWKNSQAISFSKFLQQIRKRNIVILCTAQFTNLIDIRLRQQIDWVVTCDYDKANNICSGVYIDLTSFESNPYNPNSFKIKYYAVPIFKFYNTEQLISY